MSTYSIEVSGPSTRIAMLRTLAHRAMSRLRTITTTARAVAFRGRDLTRAASSGALAILGSTTGYQILRTSARTAARTAATATQLVASFVGHQLANLGAVLHATVTLLSPTAADALADLGRQRITTPARTGLLHAAAWMRDIASILWSLSGTTLVTTTTVRAAQAAGVILGVHSLTKGAAAARLVQVIPGAMDLVLAVTNPANALALVTAAFTGALLVAALRLLHRPDPTTPDRPIRAAAHLSHEPERTPSTSTTSRRRNPVPAHLAEIVSRLNIEITPDGRVEVHGIPETIPHDLGHEIATIAADAATARLERILLHRATPNRDDRRVLTKVAREAVRTQATRPISA